MAKLPQATRAVVPYAQGLMTLSSVRESGVGSGVSYRAIDAYVWDPEAHSGAGGFVWSGELARRDLESYERNELNPPWHHVWPVQEGGFVGTVTFLEADLPGLTLGSGYPSFTAASVDGINTPARLIRWTQGLPHQVVEFPHSASEPWRLGGVWWRDGAWWVVLWIPPGYDSATASRLRVWRYGAGFGDPDLIWELTIDPGRWYPGSFEFAGHIAVLWKDSAAAVVAGDVPNKVAVFDLSDLTPTGISTGSITAGGVADPWTEWGYANRWQPGFAMGAESMRRSQPNANPDHVGSPGFNKFCIESARLSGSDLIREKVYEVGSDSWGDVDIPPLRRLELQAGETLPRVEGHTLFRHRTSVGVTKAAIFDGVVSGSAADLSGGVFIDSPWFTPAPDGSTRFPLAAAGVIEGITV